tara:strand:+ start:174 stop:494 length:321 start_codon:yes stop_codon:yes gene_type:complete
MTDEDWTPLTKEQRLQLTNIIEDNLDILFINYEWAHRNPEKVEELIRVSKQASEMLNADQRRKQEFLNEKYSDYLEQKLRNEQIENSDNVVGITQRINGVLHRRKK